MCSKITHVPCFEQQDDVYVTVSPSSNLHDADAFPDPWTFDPTRYDRGQGQNEYTYLGWGAGHHRESCLPRFPSPLISH